jgi:hypothetical protein
MNPFDWFNSDEVQGFIRHLMTTAGGGAIVTGNFDPTQWQTVVGAVVSVAGVFWSIASKRAAKNPPAATDAAPHA